MSKIESFMEWWEQSNPLIGFLVLLVLALPLGILWLIYDRS